MAEQRAQQVALLNLLRLLGGSVGDVLAQGLLTDRTPDPGLFGPGSVTWNVLREPLLLLGGSRALLMQVAHPLVAQGVIDHSKYETEPFGRLLHTSRWVYAFAFGTTNEARTAVEHLHNVHEKVRGRLTEGNATPLIGASTPYDALDRELGIWVYATLVQSMLKTHTALIGGMDSGAPDRFVLEWVEAGQLMDVHPSPAWTGIAALDAYVDDQISAGIVRPVSDARRIARTILRPPLPWPQLAPVSRLIALVTTGLLPSGLRAGYGLPWRRLDHRWLRLVCSYSRALHGYLPRRARVSPMWDLATSRLGR
jgi:uncharacterized protein (DUF2236 family)